MNDTPRTDAVYFKQGATMYDLANEMKLVERELNAANEMFKKLNIHALNLTERIKRLEETLDKTTKIASQRIKRLEDSYAAKDAQLSNLLHICRDNDIEVSSYDLIHGKEAKL